MASNPDCYIWLIACEIFRLQVSGHLKPRFYKQRIILTSTSNFNDWLTLNKIKYVIEMYRNYDNLGGILAIFFFNMLLW